VTLAVFTQVEVSRETVRLELIAASYVWKRANFELVWLPSYCPKANPIERVFGDVHDKCTRNHARRRLRTLVRDVEEHLAENGPWKYRLSEIYHTPEVDLEVDVLRIRATFE